MSLRSLSLFLYKKLPNHSLKMSVPVYTLTYSDFPLFYNFGTFGGVRLTFWPICWAPNGHVLMLPRAVSLQGSVTCPSTTELPVLH